MPPEVVQQQQRAQQQQTFDPASLPARPVSQPSSSSGAAAGGGDEGLSTLLGQNPNGFLVINVSGGATLYAENGRLVSQQQFLTDTMPKEVVVSRPVNLTNTALGLGYIRPTVTYETVRMPATAAPAPQTNRGQIVSSDYFGVATPAKTTFQNIESDAAKTYSDIQTGFNDLFVAAASTGRFLGTGGRTSQVTLTPEERSRLDLVTATAAYSLPGAAVIKGVGESSAPVGERVFDIAVGTAAFIPFGEIGSGTTSTVLKVASSFPGRTSIGAGIGALGAYLQGGSPTEIAESAVLSAGVSAGLPAFFSFGRSAFTGLRLGTEEFFLRQGVFKPSLEEVPSNPSRGPIFESNAVNRGLITYDYRTGQNVVNEKALLGLKSYFSDIETGEASISNAEIDRLVNENLPSSRFKFRTFEEPSSGGGTTGGYREVEGRNGLVSLVKTEQETEATTKQLQRQEQGQSVEQQQKQLQKIFPRSKVRLEEYYSLAAIPGQDFTLQSQQAQQFGTIQVPRFDQTQIFQQVQDQGFKQVQGFSEVYQFGYAQTFETSLKFVQDQQFVQQVQFKQSEQELFQFDFSQLESQLPLALTIPPPLRRRQKHKRRRVRDTEFVRPHMLSENILGEGAITTLGRLLF